MRAIKDLSVRELVAAVSRRELAVESVVRDYVDRIDAQEPAVRAWQHFDAGLALSQARELDRGSISGPMQGVPIGVKDIMETADMPTTYGSPIYSGHRPQVDAACVAACRQSGAVIMGKTVTTEFATFHPGPTRNPRSPSVSPRTPGGSSSGSAAAVAAGMVPLAFGTQTAGSIIRPAAYCGVVGYKPTHGTLSMAGVKQLSPSLDTLGVLARSVEDAAFFVGILARTEFPLVSQDALRVGICQTPHWECASIDSRQALSDAARLLGRSGARLVDTAWPTDWEDLARVHIDIMGHEALASFAPERQHHSALFSVEFSDFLSAARLVDSGRVVGAYELAERARCALALVFRTVDVLLAPSTEGEAPVGVHSTGNPIFNRMWTLLGVPCVHVPTGVGGQGMPIGVTVIGPRWGDAQALAAAELLQRSVKQAGS